MEQEKQLQRRVAGLHDVRMDGMTDLVCRAKGASVFDIGCNRGLVGFEFANNGASIIHGCDVDEPCIKFCRELFIDIRAVQSKFEVIDLTQGSAAVQAAFNDTSYDIVLCLATYHKLKRVMGPGALSTLMKYFGKHALKFFAWRGTSDKPQENIEEMTQLDRDLKDAGLTRIHTSEISEQLGLCAIWRRNA